MVNKDELGYNKNILKNVKKQSIITKLRTYYNVYYVNLLISNLLLNFPYI